MMVSGCPDQMSMPFALWAREAVQQLLARKFDLRVSVWTAGRYLRAWGGHLPSFEYGLEGTRQCSHRT
jgi:hypothetical protein